MTRINLVHPSELTDQHLMAEWREIKMVPAALRRSLRTQTVQTVFKKIPKDFTLNKGHVTFFYNKIDYLKDRYKALTKELFVRKFNIADRDISEIFDDNIPLVFKGNWSPTETDLAIIRQRIEEKIAMKRHWYKYMRKPLDLEPSNV